MATEFERISAEVQALSTTEKAQLVRALIGELDETEDANAEALWIEESKSLYEAYKQGEIASISGEEAIERARKRLT